MFRFTKSVSEHYNDERLKECTRLISTSNDYTMLCRLSRNHVCSRSLTSLSVVLIYRRCYSLIKFSSDSIVIIGLCIRTNIYDKFTISYKIYTHLGLSIIDMEVTIGYVSSIICVCVWISRICRTICVSIWVSSAPII